MRKIVSKVMRIGFDMIIVSRRRGMNVVIGSSKVLFVNIETQISTVYHVCGIRM